MDWQDAERRILSSLDLRREAESLGVRFTSAAPNDSGWLECHAVGRDDSTPSAAVCVAGEDRLLGRYKDLGGGDRSLSFWELAVKVGRFTDWREAREFYAGHAGVELNGVSNAQAPIAEQVKWLPWSESAAAAWCERFKRGIAPEALVRFDAKCCLWPAKSSHPHYCFALPAFRETTEPATWTLFRADGRDFPEFEGRDGKKIKARKCHNLRGGKDSWIVAGGFGAISIASVVWKVEGPSDALALSAILPEGHVVVTNTNGASATPDSLPLKVFSGKSVRVIGDADAAGIKGADRFGKAIADAGAAEVRIVRLPYDVEPKHGKDVRDWILDGGTFETLEQLAAESTPLARSAIDVPERSLLTDQANAERLVRRHGIFLRYCHPWSKWLVWDGRRWKVDDTAEIERRAKETARSIYLEASESEDKKEREALAAWAKATESKRLLAAMISLAASEDSIPIVPNQVDADPWLLNCENGTLDLRTGELREHRQRDFLTKIAAAEFDPDAECPVWLAFLDKIFAGNERLIRFLQRAAGYSLTGVTSERCLFILHGMGRNGKSTFLDTLARILQLGDYAVRTPTETLMQKHNSGGIPNDIARLKGARFVWASESEEGQRLSEPTIKDLTGDEVISARFLRAEFFDFRPEFKIWLSTNHKPAIRGTDQAIWDRIKLIPFDVRITDEEQDKRLKDKLAEELPGILAWAVRGCLEWQADGLGAPKEVDDATAAYRSEMDVIGDFINDCCFVRDYAQASASSLYDAYKKWCDEQGFHASNQKKFGNRLAERGFLRTKDWGASSRGRWAWKGIGLASNESDPVFTDDTFTEKEF